MQSKWFRIASAILGLGSLGAIGWYSHAAWRDGFTVKELRAEWLAAAAITHVLVIIALPFLWLMVLNIVRSPADARANWRDLRLLRAYSRSWMARYIPGRIWMFGGRVIYGRSVGISGRAIASSTVLEAGLSYSALGLLGVSFLAGAWIHWIVTPLLVVVFFLVTLTAMTLVIRRGAVVGDNSKRSLFIRTAPRLNRWISGPEDIRPITIARILAIFWLHAGVQLAFFGFVALAVSTFSFEQFLILGGAWGVGAAVGYLSIFSAGGLGVRDGAALALIGPSITASIAGAIVASSRILLIGVDLLFVGTVEAIAFIAVLTARNQRRANVRPAAEYIAPDTGG